MTSVIKAGIPAIKKMYPSIILIHTSVSDFPENHIYD